MTPGPVRIEVRTVHLLDGHAGQVTALGKVLWQGETQNTRQEAVEDVEERIVEVLSELFSS